MSSMISLNSFNFALLFLTQLCKTSLCSKVIQCFVKCLTKTAADVELICCSETLSKCFTSNYFTSRAQSQTKYESAEQQKSCSKA